GYESGLATARHVLGTAACLASDFAIAQRHYEEGLKLTQTTDDRLVRSALTLWLGIVMMRYENLERAYALLPEALVLYQEQQNVSCIGMVLAALAQLAMYQGLV